MVGGEAPRALKGADETIHRNRIPGRFLVYLLTFVKKGTWFLDLCYGYQTNRKVVEEAELIYITWGITEFFQFGSDLHAKTAQAHAVADLTKIDPEALLRKITENRGHPPDDLAFI